MGWKEKGCYSMFYINLKLTMFIMTKGPPMPHLSPPSLAKGALLLLMFVLTEGKSLSN